MTDALQKPRSAASTADAGRATDDSEGRVFPCEQCGANLTFHIGQQSLRCPFCDYVKEMQIDAEATIVEQDLTAMLDRLTSQRKGQAEDAPETSNAKELGCQGCGATVIFEGALTSTECAYCGSPIQLKSAHSAENDRLPVDAVLPFQVNKQQAAENLRKWVAGRWFAPNDFRHRGGQGLFNGVYLPYWTFDSATCSHYVGERGEHYYETETYTDSDGETQTRQVQRTHWYHVRGTVQRFFDDVLISATTGLPPKLLDRLEPWYLDKCIPFTRQVLVGFQARTYELGLRPGFDHAKRKMETQISRDVRSDIGGDVQQVHSIDTRYDALTYKHLLLPLWLLAYRYSETTYQVMVNAQTGEVQGERPWSWVKITLATVAGLVVAGGIGAAVYFTN